MRLLLAGAFAVSMLIVNHASAADFPTGTFTTKADNHVWAVTFDNKGKFSVTRDDKAALKGTCKINKDEIEFTDEEGDLAGKDEQAKYTYKWKVDGKKLTFTKVKDANADREAVVAGGAWEKKD
jgi:hypothetical protein